MPRKNGLSPAFAVLEEGSFKAGEGVLPVLPNCFLPHGKAEEAQACCVFLCVCGRACNTYCHWFAICQKCFPLLLFAYSGSC